MGDRNGSGKRPCDQDSEVWGSLSFANTGLIGCAKPHQSLLASKMSEQAPIASRFKRCRSKLADVQPFMPHCLAGSI
jgi:hypothetical protein